tara:strand:- start:452 stop:1084 length:633 start_codon:yes stop_codon:yes gene_type:complete
MATTKVSSSVIGDNEVKTVNILNANVTADKIASNAVTTVKINNAAVTADKLGSASVTAVKLGAGITTRAYAEDTTRKLATTLMVADDTIPQRTEGDEILTCAITRLSASSRLRIRAHCPFSVNGSMAVILALFQDTTANALAAVSTSTGDDDEMNHMTLEHEMASGSTGSTTFKLRIGPVSSANVRTNGISTGRLLGGVMKTTLTVEEIL